VEKNTFFFRQIVFLVLFFGTRVYSGDILNLEKGKYVKFSELRKVFSELKVSLQNPTLVGKVYSKEGHLKFRIDSSFYSYKKEVLKLSAPVLFENKDILFPVDLVEVIFLGILEKDIIYEVNESNVSIANIMPKNTITPEKIKLEYLILDAGHGGEDPGAVGTEELFEKEINLSVVGLLENHLHKKFPDLKVVQTRDRDEFIKLEERTGMANQKLKLSTNTIFVSIHCNSAFNSMANGFEVYYLAQTSNMEDSREMSLIQNNIIPWHDSKEIRRIQSGMMSTLIQRRSIKLADSVHLKLRDSIGKTIVSRGVKKANFHVLRRSLMPAILVEIGFISNPEERKLISDKAIQMKIAQAIVEGIKFYVEIKDSSR
jgi:N-acetylmuramoyl-L-alanine amidase